MSCLDKWNCPDELPQVLLSCTTPAMSSMVELGADFLSSVSLLQFINFVTWHSPSELHSQARSKKTYLKTKEEEQLPCEPA